MDSILSSSPFLSLPVEVIEIILQHAILDLCELLYNRYEYAAIFARFRSLFLVAKRITYILNQARPNIDVRYYPVEEPQFTILHGTTLFVQVGFCKGADDPENVPPTWRPEKWSELFQRFQASHVREDPKNCLTVPLRSGKYWGLGKFWLNPYLSVRNLSGVHCESRNLVCLILESALERSAAPLKEFETSERFQEFMRNIVTRDFSYGEIIRAVNTFGDFGFAFSVREWKVEGRFELKPSMIAPEVEEWWIFPSYIFEPCIVGFYDGKAWVFDTHEGELFTNFKPSERFPGFGYELPGQKRWYQRYWVSKWPIPHPICYV